MIIDEVKAIKDYNVVKTMDKIEAVKAGLYNVIGSDLDDRYIAALKKQIINADVIKEMGDDLVAVYTPLHGTGNIPARRVLKEVGFNKIYVVPEQEKPDGNFPTVGYPNPEDPKAFTLALALAKEKNADVVLATDPDADRLGVYAKDSKTGEYMSFTGNMSGMLIAEYILPRRRRKDLFLLTVHWSRQSFQPISQMLLPRNIILNLSKYLQASNISESRLSGLSRIIPMSICSDSRKATAVS